MGPYAINAGAAGSLGSVRPRSLGVVGVRQTTAVLSSMRVRQLVTLRNPRAVRSTASSSPLTASTGPDEERPVVK